LKAFQKVALEPGASQIVSLDLVGRDFAYYDPRLGRWVVESGTFEISVGKSSRDICLRATIYMDSTQNNYIPLTKDSYFKDVLQNEKAKEIFIKFLIKHGALPSDVTDDTVQGLSNVFVQLGVARDFTGGKITAEMMDEILVEINQAVQGSSVPK
jgi:beta-glucosidase